MIFVTGATGTVGSQVVRALLDKSARVRAGVHTQPLGIDGIESCAIDYNRFQTLLAGLEDVRTVFLVLPMIWDEHAMLAAARNVIDAARSAGVEHVVKLSALWGGGRRVSPRALAPQRGTRIRTQRHGLDVPARERLHADPVEKLDRKHP